MNLTVSVDEHIVERARVAASALGKSLNQAIREYLESLAGGRDPEAAIAELQRLRTLGQGSSGGRGFSREEAYDRTIFSR